VTAFPPVAAISSASKSSLPLFLEAVGPPPPAGGAALAGTGATGTAPTAASPVLPTPPPALGAFCALRCGAGAAPPRGAAAGAVCCTWRLPPCANQHMVRARRLRQTGIFCIPAAENCFKVDVLQVQSSRVLQGQAVLDRQPA